MEYYAGIPSLMFGGMGILSGILVLTQPESLGTKLPDTLAEAEAIGSPESMRKPAWLQQTTALLRTIARLTK